MRRILVPVARVSFLLLGCVSVALLGLHRLRANLEIPEPVRISEEQVLEYGRALLASDAWATLDAEGVPDRFMILADLNDDGVIKSDDVAAIEADAAEIIRWNDGLCNGRSPYHDRITELEDDLQLLLLHIPEKAKNWRILPAGDVGLPGWLECFRADFPLKRAEGMWPISENDAEEGAMVPLWVRAVPPLQDVPDEYVLCLAFEAPGMARQEASLRLNLVGGLGDPDYFVAARDYLAERDRAAVAFPDLFRDEVRTPSEDGGHEVFQVVALPHERTRLTVLETHFSKPWYRGAVKSVVDAAQRFAGENLIVNGNYFHVPADCGNGTATSCLGAVIVDGVLNPASGRHHWHTQADPLRPEDATWTNPVYALVQPGDAPGQIFLLPETPTEGTYVPKVRDDGAERLPCMAIGGLNTVHDFSMNVGGNESCVWITGPSHNRDALHSDRLVWVSMTDSSKSTGKCGGKAFRQALRDSGLRIEEADPQTGKGPGACEVAYFDGGASVGMAVRVGGIVEFPVLGPRHEPLYVGLRCNNYAMFQVEQRR